MDFPGPGAVLAAFLEHVKKARPFLRALVLAAELALAIPPAAIRNNRRQPRIDAARIDGDGAAKARSDRANARRVNAVLLREKGQRVAGVLDLLEADDATELAFALPAAAHIKGERDVAKVIQHLAWRKDIGGASVAAEAVQHEKCSPALARRDAIRHAHRSGKVEAGGGNGHGRLRHSRLLRPDHLRRDANIQAIAHLQRPRPPERFSGIHRLPRHEVVAACGYVSGNAHEHSEIEDKPAEVRAPLGGGRIARSWKIDTQILQ